MCLLEMAEHSAALDTSELEGLAMDCFQGQH
jgi:hypothetical protein